MVDPDDVEFDVDVLGEIDATEALFKSRSNLRNIPLENTGGLSEREMEGMEDHELVSTGSIGTPIRDKLHISNQWNH